MSDLAIRIENLGKRYVLGETHEQTLSAQFGRWLKAPFRPRTEARIAPSEFWALTNISLDIAKGEALGIVGGNGAGKSTLLKILSRITPPTKGRAQVHGRLSSLLEVGTGFHPELTGRENVFLNGTILGMRKAEVARKFDEIVAFSGVEKFIDTPVKRYSSGMYVRLAFAVAAHLEPDVLIIDEVLAVGDAEFQKRCLGKMSDVAQQGRTVIFVSHNMAAVQKLCSRAVWMDHGEVRTSGNPADVIGAYLESTAHPAESGAVKPGYAYWRAAVPTRTEVTAVRYLDAQHRPIGQSATGDSLAVEIEYTAAQPYRSFSVVLQVATLDGVPLILTSTTPDRDLAFAADAGRHRIRCVFNTIPLAAGEYLLGVGLAIPNVEYVWREDGLCRLHVALRDVFGSGLPPTSARYLIATSHDWHAPTPMQ